MARRIAFRYYPGDSSLHRWDARCKLAGFTAATVCLLHMDLPGLIFFCLLFAGTVGYLRLPWASLLRDMKGFLILLAFIFFMQSFFSPEPNPPTTWKITVSPDSLYSAALSCGRILLALLYATLFTLVTRPREVQNSLLWFLHPFRFIPARRIALMVTLSLRMLPEIMDQADEAQAAFRCRLGQSRRNVLLRMKYVVLPVFRRSLLRANEVAVALTARGYSEDLPVSFPPIPLSHIFCLAFLLALIAGSEAGLGTLVKVCGLLGRNAAPFVTENLTKLSL